MLQRLSFASAFALLTLVAFAGVSEASKGPDAAEVGFGTLFVVLAVMAVLFVIYMLKVYLGSGGTPPAGDGPAPGHH